MALKPAIWANRSDDFAFDGALIDLIAPGTGPAEWEAFWAALRSAPFELNTFRDGAPISLPETAAWFFNEGKVASVMVSARWGTVTANCHFFGGDLELDIDPREVVSEHAFESVLSLMRFVAAAIWLPVLATPESGGARCAFLRVLPDGQAMFVSPGESPHS